MQNKRKIKNVLVAPQIQIRLFIPYFLVVLIATLLMNGIIYAIMITVYELYPEMSPEDTIVLNDVLFKSVMAAAIGLAVTSIVGFAVLSSLSHRLLGPLVPIRRQLQELIAGNYSGKISLRKKDELQLVAEDLNILTSRLREEHEKKNAKS